MPATSPGAPAARDECGRTTLWSPAYPVDIAQTLSLHQRGSGDPTQRVGADGVWRTTRTAGGPATLHLRKRPGGVEATAWGPGAEQALAGVPDLLGAADRPEEFAPGHPLLADAVRRRPGLRLGRTLRVLEALVPAVLEQLVTGQEAWRSWRELLHRYGDPAPGPAPAGMRVVPEAATLARLADWQWHLAGVDGRRRATVIHVARTGASLERTTALPPAKARATLRTLPGVGPWTAAEVAARAYGDADAVPVGDYHLPATVGWALAGRPLDDAGMLEVLEPYRGQRYRVIRLLESAGPRPPRFGPRFAARDNRRH